MDDSHGLRAATRDERAAHRALVARVLRVPTAVWDELVELYHSRIGLGATIGDRLALLAELVGARLPDAPPIAGGVTQAACPGCGAHRVRPRYRRRVVDTTGAISPYTYGVCDGCGHAVLLAGAADVSVYASPGYYEVQGGDGAGYPAYEQERQYREAKGERLVRWAVAHSARPPETLLEVGSGFGFTRCGAERLGVRTSGVDLNPAAAAAAHRLYGVETFVGTLSDALREGALHAGHFDVVVYDFVLEHLADPVEELTLAATLLAPHGCLVLRVPGMDALEIVPFGSLYRSFRSDHLHLFSRASLDHILERAGLALSEYETECGADLLREVLTESELRASYAEGRGPDITACATRRENAHSPRHHS